MIEYIISENDEQYNTAKILFNEYAQHIQIDLSFQRFENELWEIKKMYTAPTGGIILCKNETGYIGCIGIRKIEDGICELKRMYVKPEFQNFGAGKGLLESAVRLAKKYKYKLMRLDTLTYMHSAMHLYKLYGFYEIQPYYHNPNPAVFFEKDLTK